MHTLGIIVFLESILSLTPAELNTVSENSWQQLLTAWHQTQFQTKEPARKHLEAARIQADDIPWSETYARFAPENWEKYGPLLDTWIEQRSPGRKARERG